MEPLIKIESDIGASVKTIHNQFLSYNGLTHRNCIYPYNLKMQNGEYFAINIPQPIYNEITKGIELPINSTNIDINILKYLINKLY